MFFTSVAVMPFGGFWMYFSLSSLMNCSSMDHSIWMEQEHFPNAAFDIFCAIRKKHQPILQQAY